ncbi:MAG: DUF1616 domain-containing protein [Caldilineaceae bacterium]
MINLHNNKLFYWIVGACAVAAALWLILSSSLVSVLLGLLIVLLLPGYAVTEALFAHQQLTWAERLLFSIGASLAIAIIGAVLFNQIGWQLTLTSWLTLFITTTLVGMLAAVLLRRQGNMITSTLAVPNFKVGHLALVGLAVLLTGAAVTVARSAAPAEDYEGYTMLWVTPQPLGDANQMQLGVRSKEFAPTQYKLELRVDDQLAAAWPAIELETNQTWSVNFTLPMEQVGQSTVEADLYRLDEPETRYRQVILRPTQ